MAGITMILSSKESAAGGTAMLKIGECVRMLPSKTIRERCAATVHMILPRYEEEGFFPGFLLVLLQ